MTHDASKACAPAAALLQDAAVRERQAGGFHISPTTAKHSNYRSRCICGGADRLAPQSQVTDLRSLISDHLLGAMVHEKVLVLKLIAPSTLPTATRSSTKR